MEVKIVNERYKNLQQRINRIPRNPYWACFTAFIMQHGNNKYTPQKAQLPLVKPRNHSPAQKYRSDPIFRAQPPILPFITGT